MVAYNAVSSAAANHVLRNIRATPIDESANNTAVTIEFSNRVQTVLIDEALYLYVVHTLANASFNAVKQIRDNTTIRQRRSRQVSEFIVIGRQIEAVF